MECLYQTYAEKSVFFFSHFVKLSLYSALINEKINEIQSTTIQEFIKEKIKTFFFRFSLFAKENESQFQNLFSTKNNVFSSYQNLAVKKTHFCCFNFSI